MAHARVIYGNSLHSPTIDPKLLIYKDFICNTQLYLRPMSLVLVTKYSLPRNARIIAQNCHQRSRPLQAVQNSSKTGPKPGNPHSGQFKAGNDSRRLTPAKYKRAEELRALARVHSEEAIETLYGIMVDTTEASRDRTACANALLDRGWGKPISGHVLLASDTPSSPQEMSTDQIMQNLAQFAASLGAVPESDALEAEYAEVSSDE